MAESLILAAVAVLTAGIFVDHGLLDRAAVRIRLWSRWIRATVADINYAAVRQRELTLGIASPRQQTVDESVDLG